MTSWGLVIIIASVILGLQQRIHGARRYAAVVAVVVVAVLYAAVRQHTV